MSEFDEKVIRLHKKISLDILNFHRKRVKYPSSYLDIAEKHDRSKQTIYTIEEEVKDKIKSIEDKEKEKRTERAKKVKEDKSKSDKS